MQYKEAKNIGKQNGITKAFRAAPNGMSKIIELKHFPDRNHLVYSLDTNKGEFEILYRDQNDRVIYQINKSESVCLEGGDVCVGN